MVAKGKRKTKNARNALEIKAFFLKNHIVAKTATTINEIAAAFNIIAAVNIGKAAIKCPIQPDPPNTAEATARLATKPIVEDTHDFNLEIGRPGKELSLNTPYQIAKLVRVCAPKAMEAPIKSKPLAKNTTNVITIPMVAIISGRPLVLR